MAEHSELVAEMALLERMSTQDRLKLARKRRIQQLKKYNQKDKEVGGKKKKNSDTASALATSAAAAAVFKSTKRGKKCDYKVHFVPSVMLLESAARNDIDEVRRLLMLGVNPDSTNEDGLTALHQCCIDDSEEMMKLLIEFGANVNARDTEKWTPLHAAATCGHLHLAKYLIEKDADLLAVNSEGNMPYDICEDDATLDYIESEMAKRGITQEIIDETRAVTENQMLKDLNHLAETSQDLEMKDHVGATPLHIAAANGYLTVVEFLLDHHVSTDVVDDDLWQPVHAAACWGHPDVLEALVQAGADLQARTKNGETPLDICEDLELKDRIIQLKSEMETKRACPTNKLKRSHSSNTRSQSVRRTSIREKSQLSRREAREEGRLRQEKGQVLVRATDEEDDHSNTTTGNNCVNNGSAAPTSADDSNDSHSHVLDLKSIQLILGDSAQHGPCMNPSANDRVDISVNHHHHHQSEREHELASAPTAASTPASREHPHLSSSSVQCSGSVSLSSSTYPVINKANTEIPLQLVGCKSQLSNGHSPLHTGAMDVKRSSDEVTTPLPSNNNHLVTRDFSRDSVRPDVKMNSSVAAGTLADLKRLRSDQRKGSERPLNPVSCDGAPETNAFSPAASNNNLPCSSPFLLDSQVTSSACPGGLLPPPSPSNTLKRFRGDPSEVVGGGESSKQGCCTIS